MDITAEPADLGILKGFSLSCFNVLAVRIANTRQTHKLDFSRKSGK